MNAAVLEKDAGPATPRVGRLVVFDTNRFLRTVRPLSVVRPLTVRLVPILVPLKFAVPATLIPAPIVSEYGAGIFMLAVAGYVDHSLAAVTGFT
jgi:hypothetical protein